MRRYPIYIHERPDWPHFRWDHAALEGKLGAVRHRQGQLLGRMQMLGFELRLEANLQTLTNDAVKTSEIEGEMLDPDQVRSSIARKLGLDTAGMPPGDRRTDAIATVLLDATENFSKPLTCERLFAWHKSLFSDQPGLAGITVGTWRNDLRGPMQVISGPIGHERIHFEAPAADRLPVEMRAFLQWFEADVPPHDWVLKAAVAHIWFVTIHPFEDGNGRIGRAIADLALARSEHISQRFYSLSARLRIERNSYYEGLEATQKGDLDITERLLWFLSVFDQALEDAEEALAVALRKSSFWHRAASLNLNDRQRAMLNRLFDGFRGKLTSSKWAKISKCSQDTALRDIEGLLALGILAREPAGGRSTSYRLLD